MDPYPTSPPAWMLELRFSPVLNLDPCPVGTRDLDPPPSPHRSRVLALDASVVLPSHPHAVVLHHSNGR